MLEVGARAPEFTLPDQDGREVSLSSFLNRGALILYFYPADFTTGCTRQACAIRDLHPQILAMRLSPQKPARHGAFRRRYQLPFTLLSDPTKSVIRMYEVDGPLGFGVQRVTLLIDPARYIRAAVRAHFRIGKHLTLIRSVLVTSAH